MLKNGIQMWAELDVNTFKTFVAVSASAKINDFQGKHALQFSSDYGATTI